MRKLCVFASLIATLVLVGCQGDEPAAEESNSLIIYSGRSESLVQPIIDQFAAETGIEVEVRYGGTAELAAALLEEGENSPADLFYAQDPGGLGAVEAAGLLAPLPQETLDSVDSFFVPESGAWVGISGRARVVVYNHEVLSEPDLPDDIMGFTDPQWAGRIGWAPTNGSFQAMVTGMRAIWGEAETTAWLEGIQANDPTVYSGNTPIVEGVAAGEVDVGFVNHYYLFRFISEQGDSFPARNYFLPGGGPGSLLMVSGAGILQSAENSANAQRFIEYLLSETGQRYFTDETFEYPVVPGITTSELLVPLDNLTGQAATVSLTELADLQGTQDLLLELGIIE